MKMNGFCKEIDTYFQLLHISMLLFSEKIEVGIFKKLACTTKCIVR